MRIKNLTSKITAQDLFGVFAFFIGFILLNVFLYYPAVSLGIPITEILTSRINSKMGFFYLVALVFPFYWLYVLVQVLCNRISDSKLAYDSGLVVKYIDFKTNGIRIFYQNSELIKDVYYKDIHSFELVIETCLAYNKYGSYAALKGLHINFKFGENAISVYTAPINLNKLCKVIYYTQFMKNFTYEITGDGVEVEGSLRKAINDFIKNNYKNTLITNLSVSVNPVILLLIFFSILGGFLIFVRSLFRY